MGMDNSPEFINMCEKAEEIQNHPVRETGGYFEDFAHEQSGTYIIQLARDNADIRGIKRTWLPRQDQLQILSNLSWKGFDVECQKYDMDTKEQAGICVVMERKFKKKWKNNDWKLDNTI